MTKLEWCRANAPASLQNCTDEELLAVMTSTLNNPEIAKPEFDDVVEYNEINDMMDYMVLTLVREFGDLLTFKGGYMLTKLMPNTARQTTDIDFSIQSSELYTRLKNTMTEIGNKFVSDGIIATYTVKDTIAPFRSGGIDMYANDGSKLLGIDVGWHDVTYGSQVTNIGICNVTAFSVERMLADKITAILSRKRFRRPKDIYDLYCITNCFDFDVTVVSDYILKRTDGAGAEWRNYPFSTDVQREYKKAYMSLRLYSIVKDVELERPPFETVLERFDVICRKLMNRDFAIYWSHKEALFKIEL